MGRTNEQSRLPQLSLDAWENVEGWLSRLDLYLMDSILAEQTRVGLSGDVLEIGCYLGKSLIVLANRIQHSENVVACDNFGIAITQENVDEIRRSYEKGYREIFELNLERFSRRKPLIHDIDSRTLAPHLSPGSFRFIHVDGSHLLEFVQADIATALGALSRDGVLVIDDYRSRHAPGVAFAMWEAVFRGELEPFLLTSRKAYCCRPGETPSFLGMLRWLLHEIGVPVLSEPFRETTVLITLEDEAVWGFTRRRLRDVVVPPAVVSLKRRFSPSRPLNYLW